MIADSTFPCTVPGKLKTTTRSVTRVQPHLWRNSVRLAISLISEVKESHVKFVVGFRRTRRCYDETYECCCVDLLDRPCSQGVSPVCGKICCAPRRRARCLPHLPLLFLDEVMPFGSISNRQISSPNPVLVADGIFDDPSVSPPASGAAKFGRERLTIFLVTDITFDDQRSSSALGPRPANARAV